MRKTLILMIITVFAPYYLRAQYIWYQGLGTAPSGEITLSQSATTYKMTTYDGNQGTDATVAMNSMNSQLSSAGVWWASVQEIEQPEDGEFEITLSVSASTESASRSVCFGTGTSYFRIIQSGSGTSPTIDLPPGGIFHNCPNQVDTVTLHYTVLGMPYTVYMVNSDGTEDEYDIITGNGGNYSYASAFPEGSFRIDGVDNSSFSASVYDAFKCIFYNSEDLPTISKDGGVCYIEMTDYVDKDGNTVELGSESDLAFLDGPFAAMNSGKLQYWDPHVNISYGYVESEYGYILISCPPNLSSTTIHNYSYLRVDDNKELELVQPGGSHLASDKVIYYCNANRSDLAAYITSSRPGVTYSLIKDGAAISIPGSSATCDREGDPLILKAPKADGSYCVRSSYFEKGNVATLMLSGCKVVCGGAAA